MSLTQIMPDKYSAIWVSHSSIGDYIKCPRAYFLKNVYKDPKTRHKMTITSPALALGQAVHDTLDCLYERSTDVRFDRNLMDEFQECWNKVSGKYGGFMSPDQEIAFKKRGEEMIKGILENPGPLKNKAVKIGLSKSLNSEMPAYYLSEEENIIICGKVDWIEYNDDDTITIIDFKTGRHEEDPNSLQLPIYTILAKMGQRREVKKVCYWYLDGEGKIVDMELPDFDESIQKVLHIAKEIKRARESRNLQCARGGCFHCGPFERVLSGEGECVGVDNLNRDIYILKES